MLATRSSAPGLAPDHALVLAALISWLATESLGAYMLANWLAAVRQSGPAAGSAGAAGMSRPVLFSHAGLAFTGFVCWVSFLITSSAVASWLAIGFLAPAIGLGISTVTVWTPYPASRPSARPDPEQPGAPLAVAASAVISDEMLDQMLADEALTDQLVDDLLASMLAPQPVLRRQRWRLEPLVPITHGVLALCTFLLAVLAAISTLR